MSGPLLTGAQKEQLYRRLRFADLDLGWLGRLVADARAEDLEGGGLAGHLLPANGFDLTTSLVPPDVRAVAELRARESLVVCGLPLVELVLSAYGDEAQFEPALAEGERAEPGRVLGVVRGVARQILEAERVLLNFLQRLSGIATGAAVWTEALGNSETRLLDTRKTTPGWRMLEKYAVACGGVWNHRLGLWERVMLKDNHLASGRACQGERLVAVVREARERFPGAVVEVEVDRPDQIGPAVEAGAQVVLLDNFTDSELRQAVATVAGRALTEASGGIILERVAGMRNLGLDFISTGALIHRAHWCDIGLDWE